MHASLDKGLRMCGMAEGVPYDCKRVGDMRVGIPRYAAIYPQPFVHDSAGSARPSSGGALVSPRRPWTSAGRPREFGGCVLACPVGSRASHVNRTALPRDAARHPIVCARESAGWANACYGMGTRIRGMGQRMLRHGHTRPRDGPTHATAWAHASAGWAAPSYDMDAPVLRMRQDIPRNACRSPADAPRHPAAWVRES
jgi:hypothetical protein